MNEILEILGGVWQGVATLSLGTAGLIILSVAGYFKKGKFVLDLFGKGEAQATAIFGEENVAAFKLYAKDIKVNEVKGEFKAFIDKQLKIENMLAFIIKTNIANGLYEDTDLEEEANELV